MSNLPKWLGHERKKQSHTMNSKKKYQLHKIWDPKISTFYKEKTWKHIVGGEKLSENSGGIWIKSSMWLIILLQCYFPGFYNFVIVIYGANIRKSWVRDI